MNWIYDELKYTFPTFAKINPGFSVDITTCIQATKRESSN